MALTKDDKDEIRNIVRDEIDASEEIRRQGVLLEEVQGDIRTALELLQTNLVVRNKVEGLEDRMKQSRTSPGHAEIHCHYALAAN